MFCHAGQEAGYPANDDFNGAEQEGVGRYDFTIRNGKRWSASFAFLRPALKRPNLDVLTHALTERVLVKNGRAIGVEVSHNGSSRRIHAENEVILAAGTVNSPQLLLLSGIGPASEIKLHGITPVHDLPGVGKNLQDHVDCVHVLGMHQAGSALRQSPCGQAGLVHDSGTLLGRGYHDYLPLRGGGVS